MDSEDWADVALATARLGRAQRMLDRHPGKPLSRDDIEASKSYRKMFEAAKESLERFEKQHG